MGSLAKDITLGGTSAMSAQAINGRVATGLTAAGSTISDALALTATMNVIGTAAANTGVKLYSAQVGDRMFVYNGGANAVKVYPDSSSNNINQLSAGAGHVLPINTCCAYFKVSSTQWIAHLSA